MKPKIKCLLLPSGDARDMNNILHQVFGLLKKEHKQETKKHYKFNWLRDDPDQIHKSRFDWYNGDVEMHQKKINEDAYPELGSDFVHARVDEKDLSKSHLPPRLISHYKNHQASLTGVQQAAIEDYKKNQMGPSPIHSLLNDKLRKGQPHESEYFKALDHHLSSALKPIPVSHSVYRGIADMELTRKMRNMKPGDSFTDKGYGSASLSPKKAVSFSTGLYADRAHDSFEHLPVLQRRHPKDAHYYNTVMKIHLPAGTKAHYLDINHHGVGDKEVTKSAAGRKEYADEREVLLHKNMRYHVTGHSIQKDAFGSAEHLHLVHVTAEQLP